jgi:glutamate-1-semialdehyde 2,1-aminomutase
LLESWDNPGVPRPHTRALLDRHLAAAEEVFTELGEAIRQGDVAARIGGPIRHSGFARLA